MENGLIVPCCHASFEGWGRTEGYAERDRWSFASNQRGWGEWKNRFPVSLSCDGEPQGEAAVFILAGKTSHEKYGNRTANQHR